MLCANTWYIEICRVSTQATHWSHAARDGYYKQYREQVTINGRDKNTLLKDRDGKVYTKGMVPEVIKGEPAVDPQAHGITLVADLEDIEEYVAQKYINIKKNARSRDKEFGLTFAHIKRMVRRKTCFYTGLDIGITDDVDNPHQLTFDRVDPHKGYVIGNVVVCSNIANKFKAKIEHEFDGIMNRADQLKMVAKMFA